MQGASEREDINIAEYSRERRWRRINEAGDFYRGAHKMHSIAIFTLANDATFPRKYYYT